MKSINTLTDREYENLLREIRHKAERDSETIKTIRDPYGTPCYDVLFRAGRAEPWVHDNADARHKANPFHIWFGWSLRRDTGARAA